MSLVADSRPPFVLRQVKVCVDFQDPAVSAWSPAAVDEKARRVRSLIDPEQQALAMIRVCDHGAHQAGSMTGPPGDRIHFEQFDQGVVQLLARRNCREATDSI